MRGGINTQEQPAQMKPDDLVLEGLHHTILYSHVIRSLPEQPKRFNFLFVIRGLLLAGTQVAIEAANADADSSYLILAGLIAKV
ncbi:MAG: hypothetical protein ACREEM_00130 [Blastocatellia bacterium]